MQFSSTIKVILGMTLMKDFSKRLEGGSAGLAFRK